MKKSMAGLPVANIQDRTLVSAMPPRSPVPRAPAMRFTVHLLGRGLVTAAS